ncbi:response regulator [Phenylobacterium koreense]|uniref:CheY-like chemotaxis protein n=1 Tax=Phenylobacterium koreense TaxID=266125 RepID=A0ABV2EEM4_9CAUL
MRILIVEDDESFLEQLEPSLQPVAGLTWTIARSRDAALEALRAGFFDAIVLDLNLPTVDRAMDIAIAHGEAVFGAAQAFSPGTPVLFLTGSSAEPIYEAILASKEKVDLFGDGTTVDTIQLFRKAKVLDFIAAITSLAERLDATDRIELIRQGVDLNLSPEDRRVLRVMGRAFSGSGVRLAPADGGLSASRVLRMTIVDAQGHEKLRGIAKLSIAPTVEDELRRSNNLHPLKQGDFAPLIMAVKDGARGTAATLYRLAEGFDRNVFQLMGESPTRAAAVVPRIQAATAPWFGAAQVQRTTVGQVRARYLSDEKAAELASTYGLGDLEALERRPLSVRVSCAHGDLHGANILVGADDRPSLIDFGDVGEACSVVDPLTLELCLFSHPLGGACRGGWLPDFSVPWENTAAYAASSPIGDFIVAARTWTHATAFGDQDVFANAYGYCLKQLKYPDTDKAFFVRAVGEMRRCLERG